MAVPEFRWSEFRRRVSLIMLVLIVAGAAMNMSVPRAVAQDLQPLPNMLPPVPPPPPPPPIYVPEVPVFGQVQQPRSVKAQRKAQPTFNDRAARCLDEATADGLSPNERAAYVGRCAN